MTGTKIPIAIGNSIGILGTALGVVLIFTAPDATDTLPRFILYAASWICLVFFPHCLSHYVVGRLVGVRFRFYFVGRSGIAKLGIPGSKLIVSRMPVLGLKVDRASLASVSRGGRAAMYVSGAAASMILPFFVAVASLGRLPLILTLALLLLSVANAAFDLYYSPRVGDMSRIKTAAQRL